jgi:hypothetical protein
MPPVDRGGKRVRHAIAGEALKFGAPPTVEGTSFAAAGQRIVELQADMKRIVAAPRTSGEVKQIITVWTPLQPSGGQLPDALPSFGENTPIGRPGQLVELASIYVLLASNDASYATGQVYGATGGRGWP